MFVQKTKQASTMQMEGTQAPSTSLIPTCVVAVPQHSVRVSDGFQLLSQFTAFFTHDGHDFVLGSELPDFHADSTATVTLRTIVGVFGLRCPPVSVLLDHSDCTRYNRHYRVTSHGRPRTHLPLQESLRMIMTDRECCRAVFRRSTARSGSCFYLSWPRQLVRIQSCPPTAYLGQDGECSSLCRSSLLRPERGALQGEVRAQANSAIATFPSACKFLYGTAVTD